MYNVHLQHHTEQYLRFRLQEKLYLNRFEFQLKKKKTYCIQIFLADSHLI